MEGKFSDPEFLWYGSTRQGATMPINRMFRDGKIKPDEVERLNRAFAFTLRSLYLVDRNDPICEIVASKVIEIDAAGTHDPAEIARLAIKQLGITLKHQDGTIRSRRGTRPVKSSPTVGDAKPNAVVRRTTLAHISMR